MRTLQSTLPPSILAGILTGRIVTRPGKLSAVGAGARKVVKPKDRSTRRRAIKTTVHANTLRSLLTGQARSRAGRLSTARAGEAIVIPKDISER
jgi:hypothetical protein